MIKVLIAFQLIFFIHFSLLAQDVSIEKLESELNVSHADTIQINILNQLSYKHMSFQPPKSKAYAEEALIASKKVGYKRGEAIALNRLSEYEFRQSNYANAIQLATQSLKLAESIHDEEVMGMAYRILGNTNTFGLKRYDLALEYQRKVYEIYNRLNDKRSIANYCGNVTWIYAITGQNLEEAQLIADQGVHIADSIGDDQLLSFNYNSKGMIFMQQNKLDSALKYLFLSIKIGEKALDNAVIAYNKSLIGQVYLKRDEPQKAIQWFTEAENESKALNLREVLKDSYNGLAMSYRAINEYKPSLENHFLYVQLKDSLLNWETTQKALITELEFAEEKKEAKIAELERANQQARAEKIGYIILFGLITISMVTVIALILRNNRQRNETNRLLQEKNNEIATQNEKLQQANDIKDKLFSIIGHDLRSPLISLKSLLSMMSSNRLTDQEFKTLAPKLNQLVISSNETLENLLQWSQSQMSGWSQHPEVHALDNLVAKCTDLFTEASKAKSISLSHSIPQGINIYGDENQIELILRNLINNAIKFTSPGGSISLTGTKENEFVRIDVADTGIGMTAEQVERLFQSEFSQTTRGTSGERGMGLGLQLCKEMVENSKGKITVSSHPGSGTTFSVYLKAG